MPGQPVIRFLFRESWEYLSCQLPASCQLPVVNCQKCLTGNWQLDRNYVLSATRSLAERDLGLAASSASVGVMGFFVRIFSSPVCSADRNACLTARSSI